MQQPDCDAHHVQTVHQARLEQANGNGRAGGEERVLPDHKASLQAKDAELQVTPSAACTLLQPAFFCSLHSSAACTLLQPALPCRLRFSAARSSSLAKQSQVAAQNPLQSSVRFTALVYQLHTCMQFP